MDEDAVRLLCQAGRPWGPSTGPPAAGQVGEETRMPRRHILSRQMLARSAAPLLVLGAVASLAIDAGPAGASAHRSAGAAAHRSATICRQRGHRAVTARGTHYV